jgi:hypothetical protein
MKQNKKTVMGLMTAAALALGGQWAGAANIDVYNGIGADTTWTSGNQYRLMEPVFVTNGATLTIQPGTVIRGLLDSNGSLVIARYSKINAQGTAANPIVFTCEGDDNIGANPGTGVWAQKNNGIGKKWGGVILLGRTYLATNIGGGTPSPNSNLGIQIEGTGDFGDLTRYGGGADDDDSGVMRYCSIRYGGFVLAGANEINGLTLGAVGRQTDIDHIEVYQNCDDDYEMFGGTVNLKYLVAWSSTDDGFDLDEGYRGKGQFFLRAQGTLSSIGEKSDKGTEEDGGMGDTTQPSTVATWYNWTQVGLGKGTSKKNTAIHLRDGSGGRFYNSMFMDFGGACALIEGDAGDADGDSASKFGETYVNNGLFGAPDGAGVPTSGNGYDHEANGSKKAEMKYNVFWKMGTNVAFSCSTNLTGEAGVWGAEHDGATKLDGNKAHYGYPLFTDASLQNYYLDESSFTNPVASLVRSTTPVTISSVNYYPVQTLNPLVQPAFQNELMTYGRVPPNDGFYTPVAFIGAFGKDKNWAAGWTLVSRLGLVTGGTAGDYTGIVPELRINGGAIEVKLGAADYAQITGDVYIVIDAKAQGWKYFNYKAGTPGYATLMPWNFAAVTLNGWLGDVAWSPITSVAGLPSGSTVYFGVDLKPGNGTIDMDRLVSTTLTLP